MVVQYGDDDAKEIKLSLPDSLERCAGFLWVPQIKKFVCGGSIKKIGTQAFRGAIKKDGVVLEDSLEDVEVGEEVF